MFNFEKLDVWQRAIEFADLVYSITARFPNDERFGLTNQMRRAAMSVSSNIAEGSSRSSSVDYARYIEIAAGSLFEVVFQASVGRRRNFLSEEDFSAIYSSAEIQSRMLSALRRSLLQSSSRAATAPLGDH